MTGNRRAAGTFVAIILGILGTGVANVPTQAQDQAGSLSASFRRAASRVRSSIVSVRPVDGMMPGAPFGLSRPGRFRPGTPGAPVINGLLDPEARAAGTGVVIDADRGYILTTNHTTEMSSQLVVQLPDGHERFTTQIRRDPRSDLVLLVIDPQGLKLSAAAWGDPNQVEPGDWVVALGQPGVGAPLMSAGIFSSRRRTGGEELIETDAAIPRISAGGALVNLKGEVIGINQHGKRRADGFDGMASAIPADRAQRVAADLAQFGQVRRPILGVQVEEFDPLTAGRREFPPGVRITGVSPGGPAAEAGLRPGDVILSVGKRPIDSLAALVEAVELAPIGEELTVTAERQGQRQEIKVRPRAIQGPSGSARLFPPGSPMVETRQLAPARRPLATDPRATPERPAVPAAPVPSAPSSPPRPSDSSVPPPLEPPGGQPEAKPN